MMIVLFVFIFLWSAVGIWSYARAVNAGMEFCGFFHLIFCVLIGPIWLYLDWKAKK